MTGFLEKAISRASGTASKFSTGKQRFNEAKARSVMPSQEELDHMSLEEIEARARGWK